MSANSASHFTRTWSIAQSLLQELETQAPVTRRFLERLPGDKLIWQPHPKSLTAGQLALHLASVPGGIARLVQNNPAQAQAAFVFPQPATLAEILAQLDESLEAARAVLPTFDDAAMNETWHLMAGEKVMFTAQRVTFLRNVMLNHWYQHRGQFSVYLRLLDRPVPASWGPSADEPALR